MSSTSPHRSFFGRFIALAMACLGLGQIAAPQGYQVGGVTSAGQPTSTTGGAFVVPPPQLAAHPTLIRGDSITISGTSTDSFQVEIAGPEGVITVPVTNDQFSALLPVGAVLGPNRINPLYFTAIAPTFDLQRSAPTTTYVTHDAVPPSLFIDFPSAGAELTTSTVDVLGRVGDLLSGYQGLTVAVNGLPAEVSVGTGNNGTFVRLSVPLALGRNVIEAVAIDALGNTQTRQVQVTRIDIPAGSPSMEYVGGNGQSAMVGTEVPGVLRVRVLRGNGEPFAGKIVSFHVTRNDGRVAGIPGATDGALLYQVAADIDGYAQAYWRLGGAAGQGNNRVEAVSADILGTVYFCASGTPGTADQINIGAGNNQRAEVGTVAPEALRVWVSDSCNAVAGIPVTFRVLEGGGLVDGATSVTKPTSTTGHAQVALTLGTLRGANVVEADFPGNPGSPAVFQIYGLERDTTQPTSFSGVVLDNAGQPIQNATCKLVVPGHPPLVTVSAFDGAFFFGDVPGSGSIDLFVHGVSATAVGGRTIPTGSFPSLHFEPVIVSNAENSLGMPVLLPMLDVDNRREYSTTQPTELTCEGIDGLKMIITAGSMRMPNGELAPDGTIVALNQVHHDDVPMPMPDGAAPPFAWTLQPGGATFDPPIRIEYPNMGALPAGAIAYFLSFDHDTGRFEIVCSGHVTDDGSTIMSDPGAGLTVAGWGCNCPPYSVTTDCENCVTTCVETGFVSCSGGVTASDATPDHMDTVVFTAGACSDSGGLERTECTDGTVTFDTVGPSPVSYSWSVVKPTGTVLTGTGSSASVLADECGTYSASFRAGVDRACAPGDVSVGSATAVVKGDLEDPKDLPSIELDLNGICKIIEFLQDIAAAYDAGPCDGSDCPDISVSIERELFQQCCVDGVHDFERWNGNLNASLGSTQCDFFVFGIPYVAQLNVRLQADAGVALTIATQQTCTSSELCFSPSLSASVGGGVSGTVGPGGIAGSLAVVLVVFGITAEADYCQMSGIEAEICIGQIAVVGTLELFSLLTIEVEHTIADGFCYSTN